MSAGNRHEYPTINIVNTNYSKYGTSVIHKNAKDTNSNSSLTGNQMNLKNQMNPLDRFDSLASTDNSDNDGTTTTTSWKLKKKYRSLLNNYTGSTSKAKRFIGRLHDHGSSDSFSIFSIRTSHSNRNLGSAHSKTPGVGVGTQTKVIREDWRPFQDINALPIEVLAIVLEQLTKGAYLHDHRAIVRCLFVSQKFYEATKIALYKAPAFTSTYRVAQFVTCLRLHPENGLHVRCIDLSSLKNGLIEDRKTGCEESLSDEDETQTGPPSPEASIDERDEDDVDSTEGNVEEGTATQTNETADSSAENDGLPSYALAGWRDWRYRFDPLYGNQMLNSYNALKRCNSRASSVISSSTGAPSRRAHRSNSSVSSFTNSLMTSFYNSTSLSSLTLTSTTNSKNKNNRNSKWFSKFFNSKRSQKVSEERPRLFRDESKNSEDIDEMEQIEEERKPSIKFCLDGGLKHQPFHESHPYTNKFLLKYSLSKDLPLGYICHLITSCPNLEELNLNNLNISSDFRVVSQDCIDRAVPTSLLPSLKEAECDMDKQVGRNLEAVYLTDSHRGHDFYQDEKLNGMKRQEQLHFASPYSMHGESWISSNYPPPISQRTKYRDQRNKFAKRSEYKLKKIEVKDLFSMFELKLPFLAKLSMDNVVWCCQPDVKEFVIGSLGRADNLMLSFKHAGMGRNLTWASQGTVRDFLAVILLGELLERDELFLQDLFNIRMERFLTALPRDYKILELSNSLQLKYRRGQIECQLEIRQDFNFHCNVQDVGNGSLGVKITLGSRKLGDEMAQRVTELTHTLLNRLQDMRAADLRRHVGQNQYAIETLKSTLLCVLRTGYQVELVSHSRLCLADKPVTKLIISTLGGAFVKTATSNSSLLNQLAYNAVRKLSTAPHKTLAPDVEVITPNGFTYKQPTGLFINNEFIKSQSGKTIAVEDPSTEQTIVEVESASPDDVNYAVDCAEAAFNSGWATCDPRTRALHLFRLADLVSERKEMIASIESMDNGKALASSRADVNIVINYLRSAAGYADKLNGRTIDTGDGYMNYTLREPIGVCGQIIPWNFPLMMLSWKIAPALAAGNTVVLKPASPTPLNALYFASLCKEAGIPAGVVNIVPGPGRSVGDTITNHPKIRKVAFTGSTQIGKDIAVKAAMSNLKKTTLELGGKSAHLVFDDANLQKTLPNLVNGIFLNAGQICSSGSRIYVQEGIYDKLLTAFKNYVEQNIKVGSPFDESNFQGAINNKSQLETILNYIDIGKAEGAKVLTGGERCAGNGFFVKPTIFYDVKEDMRIVNEEIFGPVVTISKFRTTEEAVKMANDSEFALGAGIETENLSTALKVSKMLKAGTVWVNTYNDFDSSVPFGGCKQSGYGREMGEEAFESYTQVKAVRIKLD